jgi:hypothetical protein
MSICIVSPCLNTTSVCACFVLPSPILSTQQDFVDTAMDSIILEHYYVLAYAYDLVLLVPSWRAMQTILSIAETAANYR